MTLPRDLAIGIDLGGTTVKAALVQRGHGVVREAKRPTGAERGPSHVLDVVAALSREMTESIGLDAVVGIGMGAPGVISWDRTTVSYPPNFPGWRAENVQAELRKRLETALPVLVENDGNVAGLGSAHFGAARPFASFIMVTLGTGVGGAILYEKKIFRGATGGAGELGHMTIDFDGPKPNSGVAGAVEAYLGNRFLTAHARRLLVDYPGSILYKRLGPGLEGLDPQLLDEAADGGDEGARHVFAWAGHKLGAVIGSAINLLDIRKVVVGGGVSAAGESILGPAREAVVQFVTPGLREGIEIVREPLGNEVGVLGAAHLLFEYVDERAGMGSF